MQRKYIYVSMPGNRIFREYRITIIQNNIKRQSLIYVEDIWYFNLAYLHSWDIYSPWAADFQKILGISGVVFYEILPLDRPPPPLYHKDADASVHTLICCASVD